MSDAVDEVEEEVPEAPKVLVDDAPDAFFNSLDELRDKLSKEVRKSVYTDSPTTVDFFKSDKNLYSADTTQGKYPFSNTAFDRLCKLLNVPAKFMKKLPADNAIKDLKASLYRTPLKGLNFIVKNDVIVGISDKEQTTSALEVIDRLFTPNHGFSVKNIGMSGEQLVIDFTRDTITPIIDDSLEYGLSLKHSDHDGSHPHLSHYVWRQVCSNGLIVLQLEKLAKFSNKMPKEKMLEMLNERVSYNIDLISASLGGAVDKMSTTTIPQEERKYLKSFLYKKMDFENHDDLDVGFEEKISRRAESTYYDLMNFITDAAKNFSVLERRGLEGLGGQLLSNFKSDRVTLEYFKGYAAHKFAAIQKEQNN